MALNPLGINYSAGGGSSLYFEALPIHKNQLRGSRGFTDTSFNPLPVVNGWPTSDFRLQLFSFSTKLPAWANGTFKCGFIGSGSESIAGTGGTLANIVHASGGAYTTFDFTVSAPGNVFLDVTGTTGGVTNFFAYIPGQYPGSAQIDDVTNASSLISTAVTHYSQFNHIRNMWLANIVSFTQQATSALRHTPSNFQCGSPTTNFGSTGKPKKANLTAIPQTGATSATLSSAWTGDSGVFSLSFQDQSGSGDCRIVTLTNGATTCTWDATRALTQPWSSAVGTVAYEGYPVEWLITLCNASGAAPWICLPMLEDGAQGSAGSWSTSVLNYIAANYTGTKPVIFELGNENWNPSYQTFFMAQELYRLYGFADVYHYYAYRHNQFAALARSVLPAGWFGTKVFLAHMSQFVVPGQQINALSDYAATYGPPKNDIGYMGAAIYCNPITTNTDTVAQIQSEFNTAALTVANVETNSAGGPGEQTAVIGLHYGIGAATYEGGPQWNDAQYSGLANLGAAIMDSGYTAPMETQYKSIFNAGFVLATHFQGGVNSSTAGTAPVDELSNDYTLLPTCPALLGLQASLPPNTLSITRNDISVPGTVIDGRNYTDNNPSISSTFPTLGGNGSTNPSLAPYGNPGGAGTCAYLLWSTVNRTVNLSVNFTNSGAAGITQLEWGSVINGGFSTLGGGTPTQITIPTGTNQVSIGSFPLTKGWSYILLGKPGTTQASISINSLTAGAMALSIADHKAGTQGNPTPALTANTNPTIGDALCVFLTASTGGALIPVVTDADGTYAAVGSPFSDATNTAWGQWFWRIATTTTIPTISVSGVAKTSTLYYARATGFTGVATLDTASTAQGNFSGSATTSYALSPLQTNFNNEVALIGNAAGSSVSTVSGTWAIQTASHLFTNVVTTSGTNISMAGTLSASSWYDSAVMSVYDLASGPTSTTGNTGRRRLGVRHWSTQ